MLTLRETPKEPCCEKCGQSLPTPPPLTTREKINELESKLGSGNIRFRKVSVYGAILRLIEILRELEARPTVSFAPTLPPNAVPWVPQPNIYPPVNPQPTTGDPVYPNYPTITCRNTAEKTTYPHVKVESVNGVSDATGFVGGE